MDVIQPVWDVECAVWGGGEGDVIQPVGDVGRGVGLDVVGWGVLGGLCCPSLSKLSKLSQCNR